MSRMINWIQRISTATGVTFGKPRNRTEDRIRNLVRVTPFGCRNWIFGIVQRRELLDECVAGLLRRRNVLGCESGERVVESRYAMSHVRLIGIGRTPVWTVKTGIR